MGMSHYWKVGYDNVPFVGESRKYMGHFRKVGFTTGLLLWIFNSGNVHNFIGNLDTRKPHFLIKLRISEYGKGSYLWRLKYGMCHLNGSSKMSLTQYYGNSNMGMTMFWKVGYTNGPFLWKRHPSRDPIFENLTRIVIWGNVHVLIKKLKYVNGIFLWKAKLGNGPFFEKVSLGGPFP